MRRYIRLSVLFVLVGLSFMLAGSRPLRAEDEKALAGKNRQVKDCLSRFIYGINERRPEMALSCCCSYDLKSHENETVDMRSTVEAFLETFAPISGGRLLYLSRVDIAWRGERAYVQCAMLWKAFDASTKTVSTWNTIDVFIMEPCADSMCISMMAKTPELMRSLGDIRKLSQLERIDLRQWKGAQ